MNVRVFRLAAALCVLSCAIVAVAAFWPVASRILTADRNGDGRPDVWRVYDSHGQLREIDVDSNFDGRPDIEELYDRGALVRRESDRDFNGRADLVEEFDAATHNKTRSVVDVDADGTADLLVLFRDGVPVFSRRSAPPTRAGAASSGRPVYRLAAMGSFRRLTDPFDADTVIRAAYASIDVPTLGVALVGGMPRAPADIRREATPGSQLIALRSQIRSLQAVSTSSPRAPPTL